MIKMTVTQEGDNIKANCRIEGTGFDILDELTVGVALVIKKNWTTEKNGCSFQAPA